METIDAFRDHGVAEDHLENNLIQATKELDQLKENGIDLDQLTQQLEEEGVQKFNKAYTSLLKAVKEKKQKQMA